MVTLRRLKDIYAALEDYIAGTLLFTGLTLIFINVILRYFFGKPQSRLDEYSVYFVVWGILIGIAGALRDNHHIKVDILFQALSIGVRRYVSIFANLMGLGFAMFYTYFGIELVNNYIASGQKSTDSQFPLWIVNLVMPISGILFSARFVDKLIRLFRGGGREWLDIEAGGGDH